MVNEEDSGNNMWLDGNVASPMGPGVESQARHMIQGQRQYYDMVHVIKEQVSSVFRMTCMALQTAPPDFASTCQHESPDM